MLTPTQNIQKRITCQREWIVSKGLFIVVDCSGTKREFIVYPFVVRLVCLFSIRRKAINDLKYIFIILIFLFDIQCSLQKFGGYYRCVILYIETK